jgi:hypothetical protein
MGRKRDELAKREATKWLARLTSKLPQAKGRRPSDKVNSRPNRSTSPGAPLLPSFSETTGLEEGQNTLPDKVLRTLARTGPRAMEALVNDEIGLLVRNIRRKVRCASSPLSCQDARFVALSCQDEMFCHPLSFVVAADEVAEPARLMPGGARRNGPA